MKIAYMTADWGLDPRTGRLSLGGSGDARVGVPARALAARGHEVVIGSSVAVLRTGGLLPLGEHDQSQPLMEDPDLVVLQRWMHADAPAAIRAARAAGQVVVQDVDDWFWGLDPANRAHWHTSKRRNAEVNREHYARALGAASLVTVSTEFLAKRLHERMGARTAILRNTVEDRFDSQPVREVSEGLRVGWVGALGWRSGDLETLRGTLDWFLTTTGSTFVHHGAMAHDPDTAADRIGLRSENVGPSRSAVPVLQYPSLMSGFDIGIVPLKNIPFNRAKSWIKGLEYASAGIPFVASRTSEYEALGCGLLASTPAQWRTALEALRDPALRAAQREAGLAVAAEHRIGKRIVEWEQVYADAVGRA